MSNNQISKKTRRKKPQEDIPQRKKSLMRILGTIAAIASTIAAIVAVITFIRETTTIAKDFKCDCKIISPNIGDVISEEPILIKGICTNDSPRDRFIYTVTVDENLWWPSQVEISDSQLNNRYEFENKHWLGNPEEGGGKIKFLVVCVDKNIHDQFQKWYKKCEKEKNWPGIPSENVPKWGDWNRSDSVTIIYGKPG